MFTAADWDRLVTDCAPPNVVLVATAAGHGVIGCAAARTDVSDMFLLFVDPVHAGRRIGRAFVGCRPRSPAGWGCKEGLLFTEERNTRARVIYAAASYRPDGTVRESELRGVPLGELRLVNALWDLEVQRRGASQGRGEAGAEL
jgi:hypothetical protein